MGYKIINPPRANSSFFIIYNDMLLMRALNTNAYYIIIDNNGNKNYRNGDHFTSLPAGVVHLPMGSEIVLTIEH